MRVSDKYTDVIVSLNLDNQMFGKIKGESGKDVVVKPTTGVRDQK